MIAGKIVGALVGFKLGGPLGALLGVLIGHWIDRKLRKPRRPDARAQAAAQRSAERQRVFTASVVNLAAKLAKIDGPVVREEVDAFKASFNILPGQSTAIGALYDEAKRDAADYERHARRLAEAFGDRPQLLADVLEALHRIALADGRLHPAERAFLERVGAIFGCEARPFAEQAADMADGDPYIALGVARAAPMSEIKAAWRRLTREHHPDTLMAQGMPQEYIDLATKKMAAINAAYDRIRAERGPD